MGNLSEARFGRFRVFYKQRVIEKDGVALAVGDRALDILLALLKQSGEVVSKRDLLAQVWPGIAIEEGSLRFHVAGLRKALGDGEEGARYIVNITGRGYSFVAPLEWGGGEEGTAPAPAAAEGPPAASEVPQSTPPALTLPSRHTRVIGRAEDVATITELVGRDRLVTVVGPGGIGKTRVALMAAHQLADAFLGEVRFLDFSATKDPSLAPLVVAAGLGLAVRTSDALATVLEQMVGRRALLIFDNCEHLVDAIADLIERISTECKQVSILATSREALRVDGEAVYRLSTLTYPVAEAPESAAALMAYPAAQLFVERAAAAGAAIELDQEAVTLVSLICRKLDGMPLAIELAASRVGTFGLRETASLLDSRMRLLWSGRRTAPARHRTLNATVDWSFNLLSELEQIVLARLSVFAGMFSLEAALAVAADSDGAHAAIFEAIVGLFDKSLIGSEPGAADGGYRILEVTRAYAEGKLAARGEYEVIFKRHADYYQDILRRRTEARELARAQLRGEILENVRAALSRAFSPQGDGATAIALAAAALPMFFELTLLSEGQAWASRALLLLDGEKMASASIEMELNLYHGLSLMFMQGNGGAVGPALERAMQLAESLGDSAIQMRLLSALNIYRIRIGDFAGAVDVAKRGLLIAAQVVDPAATLISQSMVGVSVHLYGDQASAHNYCAVAMEMKTIASHLLVSEFGYCHRIRTMVALGQILWLRGFPDQALVVADRTLREASERDPITQAISMIWTISVYTWCGEQAKAGELADRLIAHARENAIGPYQAVGRGLRGELMIRRGCYAAGVEILREALQALKADQHQVLRTVLVSAACRGLAGVGAFAEALAKIDEAIGLIGPEMTSFDAPELLRVKAVVLALEGEGGTEAAEALLSQSLEIAERQSALGWSLRSGVALAVLLGGAGRIWEGQAVLAPILARFNEGGETADVRSAHSILGALANPAGVDWGEHMARQLRLG